MRAAWAAALGLGLGALGCANHITSTSPPAGLGPRSEAIPSALVIDWIEVRRAGFEANPSTAGIAACAEALRSSNTFTEVYEPRRAHAAPPNSFHLTIRADETFDPHPVATGSKLAATIVTGAWPGLVVPYYYDDRVVVEGVLWTPSGERRSYRAEGSGTIRSFLLTGLSRAEDELSAHIWGEAFHALAAAITTDATLAPMPRGASEESR